jgi:hypothetical protein
MSAARRFVLSGLRHGYPRHEIFARDRACGDDAAACGDAGRKTPRAVAGGRLKCPAPLNQMTACADLSE